MRTPLGAPVLGGDFAFQVERAKPHTRGILVFQNNEPTKLPLPPGNSLRRGTPPTSPLATTYFRTDTNGDSPLIAFVPEVGVELCGLDASFQAFLFDPSRPGLVPTNSTRIRVGEVTAPIFLGHPTEHFTDRIFELGDVNGDTFLDVVAVDSSISDPLTLHVRLGTGTGDLGPVNTIQVSADPVSVVYPAFHFLALADLDLNGDLDAVIARPYSDDVLVCMGDGIGGFAAGVPFGASLAPTAVSVGRIDGDAFPDLLVANSQDVTVSVLLGDGTGSFGTASHFYAGASQTGGGIFDAELADMNGDGDLDVVSSAYWGDLVSVLLGDGTGAFGFPTSYPAPGSPHNVEIGDFNGDSNLDIGVIYTRKVGQTFPRPDVFVRLGNRDGTFGEEISLGRTAYFFPFRQVPWVLRCLDFDRDGDDELIFETLDNVVVADGRSDGTFIRRAFLHSFATGSPALGDMNGDGNLDLVDGTILLADDPGRLAQPEGIEDADNLDFLVFFPDLDEDGFVDILASNDEELVVHYGIGRGKGRFAQPLPLGDGVPYAVNDFDLDGEIDLLVGHGSGSSFDVRLGTGDGAFGPPISVAMTVSRSSGGGIDRVDVVDLEADGIPDLLTFDWRSAGTMIGSLRGNGDGSFRIHRVFNGPDEFEGIDAADLNGDGFLDLLYGGYLSASPPGGGNGEAIHFLMGTGDDGVFANETQVFPYPPEAAGTPTTIELVDLNNDQLEDLVFASMPGSTWTALGSGNGTFSPLQEVAGSYGTVVTADMNGDSIPDLVSYTTVYEIMRVHYGLGDGTFEASGSDYQFFNISAGPPAYWDWVKMVFPVDLDGDGILDLAAKGPTLVLMRSLAGE